jgi:hypothetical protein
MGGDVAGPTAALAAVGLASASARRPASATPTCARAPAAALADRRPAPRGRGRGRVSAKTTQLDAVVTQFTAEQGSTTRRAAAAEATHTDDVAPDITASGGPTALYASVLSGQDISDVLDRIASMSAVVVAASWRAGAGAAVRRPTTSADLAVLAARRGLETSGHRERAQLRPRRRRAASADATSAPVDESAAAPRRSRGRRAPDGALGLRAGPRRLLARGCAIAEAVADPAPYAVGALTDARRWPGRRTGRGRRRERPRPAGAPARRPTRPRRRRHLRDDTIGFDCSSLMVQFQRGGRRLPPYARAGKIGTHVPLACSPGDLLAHNMATPGRSTTWPSTSATGSCSTAAHATACVSRRSTQRPIGAVRPV